MRCVCPASGVVDADIVFAKVNDGGTVNDCGTRPNRARAKTPRNNLFHFGEKICYRTRRVAIRLPEQEA